MVSVICLALFGIGVRVVVDNLAFDSRDCSKEVALFKNAREFTGL